MVKERKHIAMRCPECGWTGHMGMSRGDLDDPLCPQCHDNHKLVPLVREGVQFDDSPPQNKGGE